jgi:hypothetical protein
MYPPLVEDNEALNKRIAEREAERDRLRQLLGEAVQIALFDEWDKALTGRQLWLKDARAALEGK